MINEFTASDNYDHIIETSNTRPVLLLKHSTICGVSTAAKREFDSFAEDKPEFDFWQVLVCEDRPLSQEIAEKTGIPHQSPQVVLFHKGKAIWDCSHGQITGFSLSSAVKDF